MTLIPAPPASNGAINDANKYPEWVSSGAYAAADITFSDPGFAAATVFAAIKELYDFTQVGMAATDIQAAIKEIFNFAEVGMVSTDIQAAVKELFQFANDGKTAIAAAIVGEGGTAAAGDTFAQMATEIGNVASWDPDLVVGNVKSGVDIFGVVGTLAVMALKGGLLWIAEANTARTQTNTTFTTKKEFTVKHAGKYSLQWQIKTTVDGEARVRVRLAGVVQDGGVGFQTTNQTSYVTQFFHLTNEAAIDDVIDIQICNVGPSYTTEIANVKITAIPDITVPVVTTD